MLICRIEKQNCRLGKQKNMVEIETLSDFSEWMFVSRELITWYSLNKRQLPWRGITDPYRIWVSEVILQQTRVNQGLEYYLHFIERFPDVVTLANADESEVLKCWQGLGYYSRARNLHLAAQMICSRFQGIFPPSYENILSLKGIGEYTAAAIVSLAWNKPYPVVDGNVFRFLSRLLMIDEPIDTGKGKKLFTTIANQLMDKSRAGLFNQAIMEFGALQCVPVSPVCNICPFESKCLAYAASKVSNYPVKRGNTTTQDRYLYYFHIRHNGHTFLHKRQGRGIWQHLYEFPLIESATPLSYEDLIHSSLFKVWFEKLRNSSGLHLKITGKKHVLSHRILYADFYEINITDEILPQELPFLKIKEEELEAYPVHRLMQFYLETL